MFKTLKWLKKIFNKAKTEVTNEKPKDYLNWHKCIGDGTDPLHAKPIILFDGYRYVCGHYDTKTDSYVIYELDREVICPKDRFVKWAYIPNGIEDKIFFDFY